MIRQNLRLYSWQDCPTICKGNHDFFCFSRIYKKDICSFISGLHQAKSSTTMVIRVLTILQTGTSQSGNLIKWTCIIISNTRNSTCIMLWSLVQTCSNHRATHFKQGLCDYWCRGLPTNLTQKKFSSNFDDLFFLEVIGPKEKGRGEFWELSPLCQLVMMIFLFTFLFLVKCFFLYTYDVLRSALHF